jgi:hypothetical protein
VRKKRILASVGRQHPFCASQCESFDRRECQNFVKRLLSDCRQCELRNVFQYLPSCPSALPGCFHSIMAVLPTKHLFGHLDQDELCDLPRNREAGSLFRAAATAFRQNHVLVRVFPHEHHRASAVVKHGGRTLCSRSDPAA